MDEKNRSGIKIIMLLAAVFCAAMLLFGCKGEEKAEEKLKDLDFTVLGNDEIPEELKVIIEENKHDAGKTTFVDMGQLYIIICYGDQPTTGYSIEVNELYETENTVTIKTTLKGPSKNEQILNLVTSPYIVVKLENIDKSVVYK